MKNCFTLITLFFAVQLSAQPIIIAHRGASYLAPENTVAAAELAWELGADAVEIDIHLAKDNRVMVIHDKDTRKTCSGKQNFTVSKTPSVLLRELDAGSWKDEKYKGEKIPFLSEILTTVPEGKTLVVEIKCGSEVLPHLKRVVESSGKQQQVVFISFGWQTILDTKKEFPDNKCYWLSALRPGLKRKAEKAADAGLDGLNLRYNIINREVMDLAEKHDLEMYTWTVDDPAVARNLAELGVAGITTNRPKWLKEQMEKR